MKQYIKPEIDLTLISATSIITTSGPKAIIDTTETTDVAYGKYRDFIDEELDEEEDF